jgi:NAD-reducing hydrogenase small subunit
MSLLDVDEGVLKIVELADLRSTPITDLKEPDESGVDVGILEGGINNSANEEVAHKMRQRAKVLVALGDCAVFGGVPALRNLCGVKAALERAYVEAESNAPDSQIPDDPELATMTQARAIHEVVPVDYNVPGCPPDADTIFYVITELAQGRKPEIKEEYLHWH